MSRGRSCTTACAPCYGRRARGASQALESDLPGVCPALGVRAAGVPAVPGADQGQGRDRGEVREAQLRARAQVRDLEDFNEQLEAWQAEVADVREHGTTHEPPIERFAREAAALTPQARAAGFLQAMPRSRVVADDWLVSIDTNRYSVPWRLIGATVRSGARRRTAGRSVTGRGGGRAPGAQRPATDERQARARPGGGGPQRAHALSPKAPGVPAPSASPCGARQVEQRDLAVYEQMLEVA